LVNWTRRLAGGNGWEVNITDENNGEANAKVNVYAYCA